MIALLRRALCRLVRRRGPQPEPDYLEAVKLSAERRAFIEAQYRVLNEQRRQQ